AIRGAKSRITAAAHSASQCGFPRLGHPEERPLHTREVAGSKPAAPIGKWLCRAKNSAFASSDARGRRTQNEHCVRAGAVSWLSARTSLVLPERFQAPRRADTSRARREVDLGTHLTIEDRGALLESRSIREILRGRCRKRT